MIDEQQRPTKAEEEAADWYARLNSTVIENQDLARFMEWRKSPGHRQAYDRLSAMGGRIRELRGDPGLENLADEALDRASQGKHASKARRRAWGAGAGAALAAGAALSALVIWSGGGDRYASALGERRLIQLADGSRITLNTDSVVRVRLTRGERAVTLAKGQALFEVAPDPARPFVVRSDGVEVTAIGTRFDVYRRAGAVQVTLTDGKVAVRKEGRGKSGVWALAPGQKILVGSKTARASRPSRADVAADTSWTSGQIVFRDAPLSRAVEEVNRYSARKVVLAQNAPRERLINGVFPTGDIDAFAAAASNLFDLERRDAEDGRTVELSAWPARR